MTMMGLEVLIIIMTCFWTISCLHQYRVFYSYCLGLTIGEDFLSIDKVQWRLDIEIQSWRSRVAVVIKA